MGVARRTVLQLTHSTWRQNYMDPSGRTVSFSCLSNSRSTAQPYRCRVSGATGANVCGPTLHEWNKN